MAFTKCSSANVPESLAAPQFIAENRQPFSPTAVAAARVFERLWEGNTIVNRIGGVKI